eukprot:superscaffoldBa00002213_g13562
MCVGCVLENCKLSRILDLNVTENKNLTDQVEYLTNEIHKRDWREHETKLYQAERDKGHQESPRTSGLPNNWRKLKKVVFKKREVEELLEMLHASYDELCHTYSNVSKKYNDIQQRYDADLAAEKEKNDNLQEQFEAQIMYNSNKESGHKKMQRLKIEKEALFQKMEHEAKVAAEREKSLRMKLEDLKMKLHKQTSTRARLRKDLPQKDCPSHERAERQVK